MRANDGLSQRPGKVAERDHVHRGCTLPHAQHCLFQHNPASRRRLQSQARPCSLTAEVRPSRMPSRRSNKPGKLGKARCRRLAPHDLGLLPSTGVAAARLRRQMPYAGRLVFGPTVATKGHSLSVSRDYLVEVHVVRSATAAQLRKCLHGRGTKLIEAKPGPDDWIIRINMTRDGLKWQ